MARFEKSEKSRREFAADSGIGLAVFQYWLYKLRREHATVATDKAAAPEVRLVPVTVKAWPTPTRIEIRVADLRLHVPVGADPGYVAQLTIALREGRVC
jgi:hypothetical protein